MVLYHRIERARVILPRLKRNLLSESKPFLLIRFDKYYVVFFLGEGAIMLSGLGYNGRDAKGNVLWYIVS